MSLPETAPAPVAPPPRRRRLPWPFLAAAAVGAGLVAAVALSFGGSGLADDEKGKEKEKGKEPEKTAEKGEKGEKPPPPQPEPGQPDLRPKAPAPEFEAGLPWINTAGPLSLKKDLKGKVILLDFWTLCCINCIHIQPDLKKLEKKYPNELVVIGVHSAKFENEKDTNSIRKAVLRYEITHPVINDADHKVWNRFGVEAWPTLVVVDPEGNYVGEVSGEGNYEILDLVIGKLVAEHRKKKTLDEKPLRFDLAKFREGGDTPLFFPGKVLADAAGKRLFIADSTHHRIVITDLDGKMIAVAGAGTPGNEDGAFDKVRFDDPQGMALKGDKLYVADRKNHVIRELDLTAKTVKTVAGNGQQEGDPHNRRLDKPVPARSIGLNSPWDLLVVDNRLFVAMAGHHQIWEMDLANKVIGPFAGNGREDLGDGPLPSSMFAQPSGLATDGKFLYVADSEGSAVRKLPLDGQGRVETLVGTPNVLGALFNFGDVDGKGPRDAKFQHALGVAFHGGKVWVADTYNSKLKTIDPTTLDVKTVLGGGPSGWLLGPAFNEPAGLSFAGGKLYVADTNAHRIRVVDPATMQVSTLRLTGVEPPKAAPEAKK
jgi:DNA-binding beta-propeller fold protein YncE